MTNDSRSLLEMLLEIQQIDHLLAVYGHLLEKARGETPDLVEMTALASVLHSFYTGIEKIFLYIAEGIDQNIPSGLQSHRDLLNQMAGSGAAREAVVSGEVAAQLKEYRSIYILELQRVRGLPADLVPGV